MTALDAQIAILRQQGQLDQACDLALAAGEWAKGAALAAEGGAHRRAARLWQRLEAWHRAEEALVAAGDTTEAGRLRLLTGRPRAALKVLPADATMLRAIAFAELGCWHAAAELVPALAGPNHALHARLAAQADAVAIAAGVQFAETEPDAPGCGWTGWRDDERVAVRQLPDRHAFAHTLAALDPPRPGVVGLVEASAGSLRITTRRPGVALTRFAEHAPREQVEQVMIRAQAVLAAAHRQGVVHGLLLADDVRVLPALGVVIDGWHRRHLEPVDGPWSARIDAATPPEIAVGQTVAAAADVWCVARLRKMLGLDHAAQALAPDPLTRPAW